MNTSARSVNRVTIAAQSEFPSDEKAVVAMLEKQFRSFVRIGVAECTDEVNGVVMGGDEVNADLTVTSIGVASEGVSVVDDLANSLKFYFEACFEPDDYSCQRLCQTMDFYQLFPELTYMGGFSDGESRSPLTGNGHMGLGVRLEASTGIRCSGAVLLGQEVVMQALRLEVEANLHAAF